MSCHIEMKDAPPVMSNDEETVENAEGECRHGEEIHGGDRFAVIIQKSSPSFRRLRIPWCLPHPTQNSSLRYFPAEHLQFAMDSRSSPASVFGHHLEDEIAQFPAQAFPSCTLAMPGEPGPIELEPSSMPANNSLGLNEDQSSLPTRPEPPQHNPKESVGTGKPWPRAMSREDQNLLSQGQVL